MANGIFKNEAQNYWPKGFSVVPVPPGTKRGIKGWNHYANSAPNPKTREEWLEKYANHGVGLLTGILLDDGTRLAAIDIDNNNYVDPVSRATGQFPCAKKGKKGLTIFVRVPASVKSKAFPRKGDRIVDILVTNKLCVLPPTVHPETQQPYEWVGSSLLDVESADLPFMSEEQINLLGAVIENENHTAIISGQSTHDAAVSLMASLAGKFDDQDLVCRMVEALVNPQFRVHAIS